MKTVDYAHDMRPMGAILAEEGAVDYLRMHHDRLEECIAFLEDYLIAFRNDEAFVDCGTVRIAFKGVDEAGHLHAAMCAI